MFNKYYHGDCLQVMREMPDNSVHSIVTDPPYGLSVPPDPVEVLSHWLNDEEYIHSSKGFMGAEWDSFVPGPAVWKEAFRVLKPGGYLLAFSGTRTVDLMSIAIRLSGFEIRDHIAWHYGSGFPKSHKQADGWGTALKPAMEPITVARKPLSEKSVAANIERWGTGGINIEACKVGDEVTTTVRNGNSGAHGRYGVDNRVFRRENTPGRHPANVIHDGTEFDDSYSKFFYCAKPSKAERDAGLAGPEVTKHTFQTGNGASGKPSAMSKDRQTSYKNTHPTVKPTALMEYLCKLVTPVGGRILDPFMGSGSTGRGAVLGGFQFIGIDLSAEYVSIAKQRINAAINERLK